MFANMYDEGFGRRISWKDDPVIPSGHQTTFKQALYGASSDFLIKLLVPDWALGLTQRLRDTRLAFNELQVLMPHVMPWIYIELPFLLRGI
jgi:hypothetical protein